MTPEAAALWSRLQKSDRYVFRSKAGFWRVTSEWQTVYSQRAVFELVEAGKIRSRYASCPNETYHDGETIDVRREVRP